MPQPALKKRKLNRNISARETAHTLYNSDKYNVEQWLNVISRVDRDGNIDEQREILDLFLKVFPSSARQWKYYIELELHHEHYDIALNLFKQCISAKVYDVELYKVYIALCKKTNDQQNTPKDQQLSNLNQAYKFAMKQIGQDISSASLWRQYLNFLKTNSKALQPKHGINDITLEIRNVYQEVIKLPINDCEKLWDEYISWEKSLNAQLASAWYDKFKHVHELTKQCWLERKRKRRGILLNIHTVPSNNKHAQERNYQQIQLWKRLIDFELLNKQSLDKPGFWRRMEFTFRQSLMTMSLFPDIWLMYIEWTKVNRGVDRAIAVYQQCLQRIPECLLIQFQYLEFLEKNKKIQEAEDHYGDLLTQFPDKPLIYVAYLYFLRRCKSRDMARNFFVKCASSDDTKFWQLYVATGDIEQNITNDSACASRIFGNGFKYFSDNPKFVLYYVQFLMNKKDSASKNQLKEIFDNILPQFDQKSKETEQLWKLYIKFAQRSCDLNELHDVEEKRNNQQHCNRIEKILHSIERYSFLDLLPVSKQYRDTLLHAKQTSQRKLSTIQSNILHHRNVNTHQQRRRRQNITSRIRINAFKPEDSNENKNDDDNEETDNTPFVDMTTLIDDNVNAGNISNKQDSNNITMPDVSKLHAFRPGIRFLQKMNPDDDVEDNPEEDEYFKSLRESLPPKIKELLNRLPPPEHTQLLRLDKNTSMIDIESFLTAMKLKLHDNNDVITNIL